MARSRYSTNTIVLIILLVIRIFWQGLLGFLVRNAGFTNFAINISLGGIVAILYLLALVGVIMKTKWGLAFAIISSLIDIVYILLTFFFEGNLYGNVTTLVVAFIILILSFEIHGRVR